MASWTEEIIDRMNGKTAGMPVAGNWPNVEAPDEMKWNLYLDDLKLINNNLLKEIGTFPEDKWHQQINDDRQDEPVVTYAEMVRGLIQHHIYHQGQIALLVRLLGN